MYQKNPRSLMYRKNLLLLYSLMYRKNLLLLVVRLVQLRQMYLKSR